jgi:hypothetical protein
MIIRTSDAAKRRSYEWLWIVLALIGVGIVQLGLWYVMPVPPPDYPVDP